MLFGQFVTNGGHRKYKGGRKIHGCLRPYLFIF